VTSSAIAAQELDKGNVLIDPVEVVQVNDFGTETGEAGTHRRPDVLRRAVPVHALGLEVVHDQTALGGQDDLVATSGDGPPDEGLVVAVSIDVGGVDQGDTSVDRFTNGRDRVHVVAAGLGIGPAHAHTTEPDRADAGSVLAECSLLHQTSSPLDNRSLP